MKLTICSIFIFLLFRVYSVENISAQNLDKKKTSFSIPFSLGAHAQNVKNEGLSPLVYKGMGLNGSLGFYAYSEKFLHQVNIGASYGGLTNKFFEKGNNNLIISLIGNFQYTGYYLIKKIYHEKIDWFLGGGLESFFNLRANSGMGNSAADYDFITSLNVSSLIAYDFQLYGTPIDIGWTLTVPAVNYWMKPNYISVPNFIIEDFQIVNRNSKGFTSLHEIQRVESKLEAAVTLKNGNKISLFYNWDYYYFDMGYNPVHNGMHTLAVKLYFRLR
jgi:hypothetical protein